MGCNRKVHSKNGSFLSGNAKIARLKIRSGMVRSEFGRIAFDFNDMFGGITGSGVTLHWFLPTPVRYPDGKKDEVMGYHYNYQCYGEIYNEEIHRKHFP